jgi:hypothetical protein
MKPAALREGETGPVPLLERAKEQRSDSRSCKGADQSPSGCLPRRNGGGLADGARLVFATSADFEESTASVTGKHPGVTFIAIPGERGRRVGSEPVLLLRILDRL